MVSLLSLSNDFFQHDPQTGIGHAPQALSLHSASTCQVNVGFACALQSRYAPRRQWINLITLGLATA
jgi:hypothetical protein